MDADGLLETVLGATVVLRVETLDAYDSDSDLDYVNRFRTGAPKPDPSEKAAWLGYISAAHERDHPWGRLRIVNRPVGDYVRYACEWGYTDNAAAGEDVRIIDEDDAPDTAARFRGLGDFYILDDDVLGMRYTPEGAFTCAYRVTMPDRLIRAAREAYAAAVPFSQWWVSNPDLHRDLTHV